jgi:hypothetical protein
MGIHMALPQSTRDRDIVWHWDVGEPRHRGWYYVGEDVVEPYAKILVIYGLDRCWQGMVSCIIENFDLYFLFG